MQVYMDNAATSRQKPEAVFKEIKRFFFDVNCNPGRGGYDLSLEAGREVLRAREVIARFFNVQQPNQVIFTQNVTHALNTALKGLLKPNDHVLTSGLEHNAVIRPLEALAGEKNISYTFIPTGSDGFLAPELIYKHVRPNTRMIVMTHGSNIIGSILPVEQIGKIAEELGLYFVVDCAQTAGCVPIDFQKLNLSVLAFTGHKHLLGPMGTGGFCVRQDVAEKMQPLVEGGTGSVSHREQQPGFLPDKFESGTLNTPGIVGLRVAVEYILNVGVDKIREKEMALTRRLLEGLRGLKHIKIYGPQDPAHQTGTVSINMEDVDNAELCTVLDREFGIMTRPGLHCAPVAHRTVGTFPQGTLRISLGYFTTAEEVDYVIKCLEQIDSSLS